MPRCCPRRGSWQPTSSSSAATSSSIRFGEFLRIGVPITVATLAWGAAWLWMTG
jgi:Na+/H+ antiporter NhaD/arsenite permease-like protein